MQLFYEDNVFYLTLNYHRLLSTLIPGKFGSRCAIDREILSAINRRVHLQLPSDEFCVFFDTPEWTPRRGACTNDREQYTVNQGPRTYRRPRTTTMIVHRMSSRLAQRSCGLPGDNKAHAELRERPVVAAPPCARSPPGPARLARTWQRPPPGSSRLPQCACSPGRCTTRPSPQNF